MKLRVRLGSEGRTCVVEVDNINVMLGDLKETVRSTLQLQGCQFELSLNGATPIIVPNDDTTTLEHCGVVSGDLLHILLPPGQQPQGQALSQDQCQLHSQGSPQGQGNSQHQASSAITQENCQAKNSSPGLSLVNNQSPCGTRTNFTPAARGCDAGADTSRTEVAMMVGCEGHLETTAMEEDTELVDVEVNRYLREPTLVRDSTDLALPPSLTAAYEEIKPCSNHEVLAVVLHVLMTELGYKIKSCLGEREGGSWRVGGSVDGGLRMDYSYTQIESTIFQLVCVPMKSQLIVHGTVRMLTEGKSHRAQLHLKTNDFIRSTADQSLKSPLKRPAACDVYVGRQLSRLSQLFKDSIAYSLLQFVLTESELPVLCGLSTFVFELQLRILQYVDVPSLLQVSETCQSLRAVAREPALWRRRYLREFGRRDDMSLSQDWLNLYKEKYTQRKESLAARRAMMNHLYHLPHCTPSPSNPYLPPPYPGGLIIGGDYDLNPTGLNPLGLPDPFSPPQPFRFGPPTGPPFHPLAPHRLDADLNPAFDHNLEPLNNSDPLGFSYPSSSDFTGRLLPLRTHQPNINRLLPRFL